MLLSRENSKVPRSPSGPEPLAVGLLAGSHGIPLANRTAPILRMGLLHLLQFVKERLTLVLRDFREDRRRLAGVLVPQGLDPHRVLERRVLLLRRVRELRVHDIRRRLVEFV